MFIFRCDGGRQTRRGGTHRKAPTLTADALRAALRISYVAVVWGAVSGVAALLIGARSGSTALIGTGADVLADMVSSVVLVWRFRHESRGEHPGDRTERRAQLVASLALLLVAAGVAAGAVIRLASGRGATADAWSIAVAVASVVVLPLLAAVKLQIAPAVPSRALRTDALITLVGASTAALSLVGLLVTHALRWTAADPSAALAIAVLAGITGVGELPRRG